MDSGFVFKLNENLGMASVNLELISSLKMKSFVFLSMLSLAAAVSERILERLPPFMSQPTDRIIDGHPITEREEAPWIGSLVDTYYGTGHFCGCSVIDEWHILTAGHCVFPSSPQDYIVYLGFADYDTSDSYVQQRAVSTIRRHPDYSASSLKNDIAILKLTEPLQFNEYVKPILLPDYGLEKIGEGDKMNVLGWGVTTVGANQASQHLLAAEVIYDNDVECVQNYSSVYPVYTCGMLCASEPGRDACQGDSGGPLVLAYGEQPMPYQVGIVSWGYGCAQPGYAGIYTKVSKYLGWIRTCTLDMESNDCITPQEEYVC